MSIPASSTSASDAMDRLEQLFSRVRANLDFLLTINVSNHIDRARSLMALMNEGMNYLDYIANVTPGSIMPRHVEFATVMTAADAFCDSIEKYRASVEGHHRD